MFKVLSVSHDPVIGRWQHSVLEAGGYTVASAVDGVEASRFIHAAEVHAMLLGSAVAVDDRTSLALLAFNNNIPVVCTCGLSSSGECPVIHVPPFEPEQVLEALATSLGNQQRSRAVGT